MSRHSSLAPAFQPQSAHITPPLPSNDQKEQAREQFQRLFGVVSDCMAEYLNSKTPEEYQTTFDALGKPLVRRLYSSLFIAEYARLQVLFHDHSLAMQNIPGGSWDLEGYDLLRWHGALNRLPRSRRVVTLKNNLSTLENIISVLTANYDPALEEELELPDPSVDEDEVAEVVPVLDPRNRRANTLPPSSIRVKRSTIPPPPRTSRLPPASLPANNPPAPAERPRPRGLAYPVVGALENLPPVSSLSFIFSLSELLYFF
jgi:hypothetical protein